jgi:hypothetical protein
MLSSSPLDCRTYWFQYPKLEAVLAKLQPGVLFDKNEHLMLCTLGMEYADDFMLISPLNLCLTTEILPEKVLFLYSSAETAISMLHEEKQHIIYEMEELRCEWNMMHDDHDSD